LWDRGAYSLQGHRGRPDGGVEGAQEDGVSQKHMGKQATQEGKNESNADYAIKARSARLEGVPWTLHQVHCVTAGGVVTQVLR
jgi:hypothetical protein